MQASHGLQDVGGGRVSDPPGRREEAAVLLREPFEEGLEFLGVALGGQLGGEGVDGEPVDEVLGGRRYIGGAQLAQPDAGEPAEFGVVEDVPYGGFGLRSDEGQGLLAAQPAQRRALVRAAGGGEQFAGGGEGFAPVQPLFGLGAGGERSVAGAAVEEGVGALVDEVADGGCAEAGLQEAGAEPVEAEGVRRTMP